MYLKLNYYNNTDLKKHLETLSTDDNVTSSIQKLWSSNNHIKNLCRLPLNMVILLSILKNGEGSDFNSRTEIYSAFMNVTVKQIVSKGGIHFLCGAVYQMYLIHTARYCVQLSKCWPEVICYETLFVN